MAKLIAIRRNNASVEEPSIRSYTFVMFTLIDSSCIVNRVVLVLSISRRSEDGVTLTCLGGAALLQEELIVRFARKTSFLTF